MTSHCPRSHRWHSIFYSTGRDVFQLEYRWRLFIEYFFFYATAERLGRYSNGIHCSTKRGPAAYSFIWFANVLWHKDWKSFTTSNTKTSNDKTLSRSEKWIECKRCVHFPKQLHWGRRWKLKQRHFSDFCRVEESERTQLNSSQKCLEHRHLSRILGFRNLI